MSAAGACAGPRESASVDYRSRCAGHQARSGSRSEFSSSLKRMYDLDVARPETDVGKI